MRGDRPRVDSPNGFYPPFTPHARGSTPAVVLAIVGIKVYPACAGIDLVVIAIVEVGEGLPRMRGDRPQLGKKH